MIVHESHVLDDQYSSHADMEETSVDVEAGVVQLAGEWGMVKAKSLGDAGITGGEIPPSDSNSTSS